MNHSVLVHLLVLTVTTAKDRSTIANRIEITMSTTLTLTLPTRTTRTITARNAFSRSLMMSGHTVPAPKTAKRASVFTRTRMKMPKAGMKKMRSLIFCPKLMIIMTKMK